MFQIKVVEEIATHIFFFNNFFFEIRALYEIMWKNIVEWGKPQMTIWRMRFVLAITKATDAHPQYEILTAFPLRQSLLERTSVLSFM